MKNKDKQKKKKLNWKTIDEQSIDKSIFGYSRITISKVAKWHGRYDIRAYKKNGWQCFAELLDINPKNGKQMKTSKWFIFKAKGK